MELGLYLKKEQSLQLENFSLAVVSEVIGETSVTVVISLIESVNIGILF